MAEIMKGAVSRTAAKVGPIVHLTVDGLKALCGAPVGHVVSYREFSDRPCSCCIANRLSPSGDEESR